MERLQGIVGIVVILCLAYLFSTDRRAIRFKTVAWGLGLQVAFAFLVLRFEWGQRIFAVAGSGVEKLLSYTFAGSEFVFGPAGAAPGARPYGFYFAFMVLPTIIFMAAFFAILYHFGVMQVIIKGMAKLMTWLMGVSGAESLNVAASVFMGQTEAPLTIRPFLPHVTKSEMMTIMTAGMAHVSGGIMGAYIAYGVEAKHLLGAVIMTAPGTILLAKMLVPETEQPITANKVEVPESDKLRHENLFGAISHGTIDGLHLALNVAAMLISFLALIALINGMMGGVHNMLANHGIGWFPSSMQAILGKIFWPVAWMIGIPAHDAGAVGNLLGIRMVLNELVAFSMLGPQKAMLDPRSFTIATFALCGFANFSSIGIQIGGISALAPNKKDLLAKLGLRAMLAGTMANLISASIVGIMYHR
jgi:CNT family concentrative nucleoside transporter